MIYLIAATVANGISPIFKKGYKKNCVIFFSAVLALAACLFFVVTSGFKFDFNKEFIPFSVLFAISYATCSIFEVSAFKKGSIMITGLVFSFSLLIPTFFGLIAFNEDGGPLFWLGLVFLCMSLTFINVKSLRKKEKNNEKSYNKLSISYIICLIVACIANGCCSVIQTSEQKMLNGAYKNEFMIVALFISSMVLFIFSFIKERKELRSSVKQAISLGGISGILNGLLNICVMFSVNQFPTSVVFPVICGGALIVNYLIALLIFKEKYTPLQYVGLIFGFFAVILLNI